jgi:hypothetical protein
MPEPRCQAEPAGELRLQPVTAEFPEATVHRHLHCARHVSRQLIFLLLVLAVALSAAASVSTVSVQSRMPGTWTGIVGVASDAAGNLYVAQNNSGGAILKLEANTRAVSTYIAAGTVVGATSLGAVQQLAIDSSSNLFIADQGNNRIVKWSLTSNALVAVYPAVAPVAVALDHSGNLWLGGGSGEIWRVPAGSSTGTAPTLMISSGLGGAITGLAFSSGNDLYVSDYANNRIVKFASPGNGTETTVVSSAGLPCGLYLDAGNNLYVAHASAGTVQMFTAASSYLSSVYVGSGMSGAIDLAADPSGNLLVGATSGASLWQISLNGNGLFGSVSVGATSSTAVTANLLVTSGTTIGSFAFTDQGTTGLNFAAMSPDTNSNLCTTGAYASSTYCAVDLVFQPSSAGEKRGALLVLDTTETVLLDEIFVHGVGSDPQIAIIPGVITTVAGTGTACSVSGCGDGAAATSAQLWQPTDVALDGAGNLYIADSYDERIRKVDAKTLLISTVAGSGSACASSTATCGDGAAATSAQLATPRAITVDGAGNLYIADSAAHRIRRVDAVTRLISTVAGTGVQCAATTNTCGDGGAATSAQLNQPWGVAVDGVGNLYIADTFDHRIRRVNVVTGIITTVAGAGTQCSSSTSACGDGGAATSAYLAEPNNLVVDSAGNLYIADFLDNRIRLVNAGTGLISTVVGTGASCTSNGACGDGGAAAGALLNYPSFVDMDGAGNLYIADRNTMRVRKVDAATQTISTIAGTGTACSGATCGEGGAATSAALAALYSLRVNRSGNLFLALADSNVIRLVSAAAAPLTFASTATGSHTTDQVVTFSNIGNQTVSYSAATATASFVLDTSASTCAASGTLAAGASCAASVYFNPQSVGSLSDALTFTDDAVTTTQTVALSGAGLAAQSSQTIAFPNPGAQTYGVGSITLTASASSGLAITYVVLSGPATVSGSTLTITGAGTVTVQANQAGNSSWTAAPSVSVSFAVNTRPLTITANNDSKVYGQTKTYGSGSTAFTATGLENGETIGSVTLTASGGTAANSAVGSYSLTPSAATGGTFIPANYTITYVAGALSVTAAPLTITANNDSKVYGQTRTYGAGSTAFTSSGLLNGETIGSVTITPSGGSANNLAVGTYQLTPGAATGGTFTASNYSITYVAGTLTVSPAALSITATNDTKPYGVARSYGAGSTSFTAIGLQNSETIASVTITASGGTAATDPLGRYSLTPSAATGGTFTAGNYTITYVPGTLTVVPGTLIITANADTKPYGQSKTYGAGSTAFTVSGIAPGETVGSVTITANGGADATSPVGLYTLTPSAATGGTFTATNYSISYVAGALTVTAAPLTITASNDSKVYGQARTYGAGSTAYTAVGLLNGETIGSVTLTASGGAAANGAVGSYSLTPSAATGGTFTATNYSISYVAGALTVTAAPLTITATNESKTYGVAKTYSSGSTAFTSSGLVAGDVISTVTITASGGGTATAPVGSYTLTASSPVGANFSASNYAITYYTGTLTVAAAPLSITVTNDTKSYGQVRTYGASSTGFSAVGLVNNESIGTVTITASGGMAANAPLGVYTLTPSNAVGGTFTPSNYTITYYPGTLTVVSASLVITANADSKAYGVAKTYGSGSTAFTSVGLASGDTITSVTLTPSGGAAATAPVGAYSLTPSAAVGNFNPVNYVITYVPGVLTVSPVALTITAGSDTKVYGQTRTYGAGSTLFTAVGLMNGEAVSSVTLTPSGGAAANGAVGAYQLVPSAAVGSGTFAATNYNINYVAGTLTVTTAPLSITASNQTKTYGQVLTFGPGATAFTATGLVGGDAIASVTLTATGGGTATAPVGRYTLTPSSPVGSTFTAGNYSITYYSGTLTVTTAPLTITATNDTKTYGQTKTYGTVTSGFTATGLASGDTIGTMTITASGGTSAGAPLGVYTLTPSAATGGTFVAGNYNITYVAGTLTVNAAALTITASNDTKTYGATKSYGVMTTGYTAVGLAAGDTIGTVTITASGGTAANAPVGSYTLMPGSAAGGTFVPGNYTITYAGGTLTVNAAPLTITAANDAKTYGQTKTYGAGSTAFTAVGLVNGETIGSVTITASGGADATSAAGAYLLTPSLATGGTFTASNYTISYVAGALIVGKAGSLAALTTSSATSVANASVTFTAVVTSTTIGTPTGSVAFMDGATTLGTGKLDSTGTAKLATSTLTAGTHTITGVYAGDTNFLTITSNAVTQTVQDFQFIINGSNVNGATSPVATQAVTRGQAATYQFQISPSPSATFPFTIALSVTSLPAGATYTVSPATIAAGSAAQTVTVVVQTSSASAALTPHGKGVPGGVAFGLLLPALGLLRFRRAGRRTRRMLLLGLLLIALLAFGLAGCGGSSQGFYGSTATTYNMQLVGASGTLQHFTTFSITVN